MRLHRVVAVTVLTWIGVCEVITTSPWLDVSSVSDWLMAPIVMTGFFGVIVLTTFIGNGIIAISSFLVTWRGWRWPLWAASLVSLPFWIVTSRLSLKPW